MEMLWVLLLIAMGGVIGYAIARLIHEYDEYYRGYNQGVEDTNTRIRKVLSNDPPNHHPNLFWNESFRRDK